MLPTEQPSDTGQNLKKAEENPSPLSEIPSKLKTEPIPPLDQQPLQPLSMAPRQPFRQKFQRWPNQPPRWNQMGPNQQQQQQQQMPFQRGPLLRPPGHNMMQGGPQGGGPHRQMRPGGFPPRPPFFNNNFMPSDGHMRMPMVRQRFFYPNSSQHGDQSMSGGAPGYAPSMMSGGNPAPSMPRKVLINPNFKGGVEAAKSKIT